MLRRILVALLLLLMSWASAAAERLVISLSNHRVMVTTNYTGVDLVLFGSVERDRATPAPRSGYDVVITVAGPRDTELTRRKSRVAGIWVNAESRRFIGVPAYLAILSSKPTKTIASNDTLRRLQTGLDNFELPQHIGPDSAEAAKDDPFRAAFVRLKKEQDLYSDRDNAVTFLTPTLFRADVPIPANVPFGIHAIDVKLFADGAMIARSSTAFEVMKVGSEQFIASAAREDGLVYGLATALMALATGWLASIVFRRD
jgi:uncharacterized protein (TIGR02186 family)